MIYLSPRGEYIKGRIHQGRKYRHLSQDVRLALPKKKKRLKNFRNEACESWRLFDCISYGEAKRDAASKEPSCVRIGRFLVVRVVQGVFGDADLSAHIQRFLWGPFFVAHDSMVLDEKVRERDRERRVSEDVSSVHPSCMTASCIRKKDK